MVPSQSPKSASIDVETMNRKVTIGAVACVAALAGVERSSAIAGDRDLQAILDKSACVGDNISDTKLSAVVRVYEGACQTGTYLTIVCSDAECQLQAKARRGSERGQVGEPAHE